MERMIAGTEANIAMSLSAVMVVLVVGYVAIRWIWRKLGEPRKPDPFWDNDELTK